MTDVAIILYRYPYPFSFMLHVFVPSVIPISWYMFLKAPPWRR